MAIYSRKYGKHFKNQRSLSFHDWHVRRTSPIFSWFGLRDAPYSDEWLEQHGKPRRIKGRTRDLIRWFVFGVYFSVIFQILVRGCSG